MAVQLGIGSARVLCLADGLGPEAGAVASDFRMEIPYLAGWIAYAMIALGLLFFIPVVISIGRRPGSRLYPHARNAYLGWGVSCYLLGVALATQVAQIAAGPGAH